MPNAMFENNYDYGDTVKVQADYRRQKLITKVLIHQKFESETNVIRRESLNSNDERYLVV